MRRRFLSFVTAAAIAATGALIAPSTATAEWEAPARTWTQTSERGFFLVELMTHDGRVGFPDVGDNDPPYGGSPHMAVLLSSLWSVDPDGTWHRPVVDKWEAVVTATGAPDCAVTEKVAGTGSDSYEYMYLYKARKSGGGSCDVSVQVTARLKWASEPGRPAITEKATLTGGSYALSVYTRHDALKLAKDTVERGKAVTLTGVLRTGIGYVEGYGRLGGQRVDLEYRAEGSSTWTTVAHTTSAADGTWKMKHKPPTHGHYRAAFRGTRYMLASKSRTVAVQVGAATKPVKLSKVKVAKTLKAKKATTVSGKVTAKSAGKYRGLKSKVSLQHKASGSRKWVTLKTVKTDAAGKWKAKVKVPTSGQLRVVHKRTGSYKDAASTAAKVTVK